MSFVQHEFTANIITRDSDYQVTIRQRSCQCGRECCEKWDWAITQLRNGSPYGDPLHSGTEKCWYDAMSAWDAAKKGNPLLKDFGVVGMSGNPPRRPGYQVSLSGQVAGKISRSGGVEVKPHVQS